MRIEIVSPLGCRSMRHFLADFLENLKVDRRPNPKSVGMSSNVMRPNDRDPCLRHFKRCCNARHNPSRWLRLASHCSKK